MKAVVLEIENREAAVLAEDGSFRKITDRGYAVGQEIELTEEVLPLQKKRFSKRVGAAAACAAMAVIVGSGLFYASETVFAYSTVEIETKTASIRLKLNKKDQLIGITTDQDADPELAGIISELVRKRSSLDDAVTALSDSLDAEAEVNVESSDDAHASALRDEVKKMMPEKSAHSGENAAAAAGREDGAESALEGSPEADEQKENDAAPEAASKDPADERMQQGLEMLPKTAAGETGNGGQTAGIAEETFSTERDPDAESSMPASSGDGTDSGRNMKSEPQGVSSDKAAGQDEQMLPKDRMASEHDTQTNAGGTERDGAADAAEEREEGTFVREEYAQQNPNGGDAEGSSGQERAQDTCAPKDQ